MAYCIKCGNLLEEGAAFCSKCGNPVSGNGTSDKEVSNNEACEIVVHGRSCTVGSILKNLFICIKSSLNYIQKTARERAPSRFCSL